MPIGWRLETLLILRVCVSGWGYDFTNLNHLQRQTPGPTGSPISLQRRWSMTWTNRVTSTRTRTRGSSLLGAPGAINEVTHHKITVFYKYCLESLARSRFQRCSNSKLCPRPFNHHPQASLTQTLRLKRWCWRMETSLLERRTLRMI